MGRGFRARFHPQEPVRPRHAVTVRKFRVDLVILRAHGPWTQTRNPGLERIIADVVNVPVWIFPRNTTGFQSPGTSPKRILLPVSDAPQNEFVFRFALEL